MVEGNSAKYVYFIESGEFEVNKNIYINKGRTESYHDYLRFTSPKDCEFMKEVLDPQTRILYSTNERELELFNLIIKQKRSAIHKSNIRISSITGFDCFGLLECYVECPYSITTVTCISQEAVVYRVKMDEFRMKLEPRSLAAILSNIRNKLTFMYQRITSTSHINKIEINPSYFKTNIQYAYKPKESVLPISKPSDTSTKVAIEKSRIQPLEETQEEQKEVVGNTTIDRRRLVESFEVDHYLRAGIRKIAGREIDQHELERQVDKFNQSKIEQESEENPNYDDTNDLDVLKQFDDSHSQQKILIDLGDQENNTVSNLEEANNNSKTEENNDLIDNNIIPNEKEALPNIHAQGTISVIEETLNKITLQKRSLFDSKLINESSKSEVSDHYSKDNESEDAKEEYTEINIIDQNSVVINNTSNNVKIQTKSTLLEGAETINESEVQAKYKNDIMSYKHYNSSERKKSEKIEDNFDPESSSKPFKHLKQINYQKEIPKIRSVAESPNIVIQNHK